MTNLNENKMEGVQSQEHLTSKDFYWNNFSHFRTHEQLLKDTERVEIFKKAITQNRHLFQNKVVLDVGCGTGILSLFAAQAGAKEVIAVECSEIITQAQQIITDNNFSHIIRCVRGKIENVDIGVPKNSVDIIIADWKPDGLILPDRAYLYIAAVEDGEYKSEKLTYWRNIYGFDLSPMQPLVLREPLIDTISPEAIVTNFSRVILLDLQKMPRFSNPTEESLFKIVESNFELNAQRNDKVHGFTLYYDIEFSKCHKPIYFSTSPNSRSTGFKQTILWLSRDISLTNNQNISGKITFKMRGVNFKHLEIILNFEVQATKSSRMTSNSPSKQSFEQHFYLSTS
eukprot:TRINITY_DN1484_c1_g1_i1.p1 TRINITY_DN1484_c1_g1~~TRINITY_DN1484_c1_g1_i1.p1  ORF type:complete len:342 (+),score=132.91 TRINITY_DN1484_c1_g1_i1:76-1101(+)